MKVFIIVLGGISMVPLATAQTGSWGGPGTVSPEYGTAGRELPSDADIRALRSAGGIIEPRPVPRRRDGFGLEALSEYLIGFGTHAMLPKGSILFCPDARASQRAGQAKGRPTPWPDFLAGNRGWVTTFEVSLAQIRGEEPVPAEKWESFSADGKVVVATHRGLPVTVLAPPPTVPSP
ncbi:hypothetical protein HNR46_002013 [Haloferula luteola]|uniref:Uncharacterized protein n=1 Tax=Haloferula luteola TaxID=595692 RepID=A0A840V860_9BACT|nr:hypothetical protein [Haloferula luteola]MBB5351774.1 hypothetical protein [Haloferula luteola]